MSSNPELVIELLDRPRHVKLSGDLDVASAPVVEARFTDEFDQPDTISIDASGISFIDSSGLRALIRISLRTGDGALILLNPSSQLRRLVDVSGLEQGNRIRIVDGPCCTEG